MYVYFNKAKAFLENFPERRQFLLFNFLGKDVTQLLQRQYRESLKLQMVSSSSFSEVFQKASNPLHSSSKLMKVSENCNYGKLQVMDWNDTWYLSIFMLKIFSQSIFICPINLPNVFQYKLLWVFNQVLAPSEQFLKQSFFKSDD